MTFIDKDSVLKFLQSKKNDRPEMELKHLQDELRNTFSNNHTVTELGQSKDNKGVHIKKISAPDEQLILPGVDSCLAVIASTDQNNKIVSHIGIYDCSVTDPLSKHYNSTYNLQSSSIDSAMIAIGGIQAEKSPGEKITKFECIGGYEWKQYFKEAITAYNAANLRDKITTNVDFKTQYKTFDLLVSNHGNIVIETEELKNIKPMAQSSFVDKLSEKARLSTPSNSGHSR
jgi:hypothetical protein